MYYERRKNNPVGIMLISGFLVIIIIILVNLINKIDKNININDMEAELTGTNTVLAEFNIENLVENASFSIVGISKLNENNSSIFVKDSAEKLGIGSGVILTSDGYILTNYSISRRRKKYMLCNVKKWKYLSC